MMEYAAIVLAAVWFAVTLLVLVNLASLRDVPRLATTDTKPPRVTVIIAARDEQARIGETLDRLFAQQMVDLDVIVVDDRSTDGTPTILAAATEKYSRFTVLRVDELPPGWLGKCHACSLAASQATGDWLLFTDADVHMRPDLIARAVAAAERQAADHVTLWPGLNCTGTLTRGAMLAFQQMFALYAPVWQINRDRGSRGLGVGAFNLVRRPPTRPSAGTSRCDSKCSTTSSSASCSAAAAFGSASIQGLTELEADWAHGVLGVIRAMEKNWFAATNFNSLQAAALILAFAAVTVGPATAPWWAPVTAAGRSPDCSRASSPAGSNAAVQTGPSTPRCSPRSATSFSP